MAPQTTWQPAVIRNVVAAVMSRQLVPTPHAKEYNKLTSVEQFVCHFSISLDKFVSRDFSMLVMSTIYL